ncbi:unnamed protein product [Auanema sp. JU1783]|nr:unnamed protein product [Auanema sp. JU1783]
MDVDLESVEIVFAQKLASGEPATRRRALNTLRDWITQQSKVKAFDMADMTRLTQGLHYVLWMQDKMLLQEELSDNICSFFMNFETDQERQLFVKCSFTSLAKSWHNIDKWRVDKFLLHLRKLIFQLFKHLASIKWKKALRDQYFAAIKESIFTNSTHVSDGLKFHFCSLFLDELDKAGGLSKKQVSNILQFFVDIIKEKSISDYLFNTILKECFETILHSLSEDFAAKENGEEIPAGLEFDYKAIGKMLFDVGKHPDVKSARRKELYKMVKLFDIAAKGKDPLAFEAPEAAIYLAAEDIEKAADELIKQEEENREERQLHRTTRKKRSAATLVGEDIELEKKDFKTPKTKAELKIDELKNKVKKPMKKKPKKSLTPKKIENTEATSKVTKSITKKTPTRRSTRRK